MKTYITRILSALSAAIGVGLLYYFWQDDGFRILISFGVFMGGYELVSILFKSPSSKLSQILFYSFLIFIYVLSSRFPAWSGVIFGFFSIVFCLLSLLLQYKFVDLVALTQFQAKSILGFFYLGLLPSYMIQILDLNNGPIWFLTLLAIVFAGDIGAYVVGMNFGRTKIMPVISPKKTVEGSIGGLACSLATGFAAHIFLPQASPVSLVFLALAASILAQFGDLFESLLKRVADVKDSGRIMPGHGGVLDRVDGALFASPIVLFGAAFLEGALT